MEERRAPRIRRFTAAFTIRVFLAAVAAKFLCRAAETVLALSRGSAMYPHATSGPVPGGVQHGHIPAANVDRAVKFVLRSELAALGNGNAVD